MVQKPYIIECYTLSDLQIQHYETSDCPLPTHSVKKEKKIFLIEKVIQMGSVAKSYMRKGFLIYEEMRQYLVIHYTVYQCMYICKGLLKSCIVIWAEL
jgi:hypothetical protein